MRRRGVIFAVDAALQFGEVEFEELLQLKVVPLHASAGAELDAEEVVVGCCCFGRWWYNIFIGGFVRHSFHGVSFHFTDS